MIEDTLNAVANSSEAEGQGRRMQGVTTGRVIDVNDPFFLGRVKVQLGSIDAVDPQPWARLALPMAGAEHGTYFVPNVGDEVLVAFEHGSLSAPYVLGALWTAVAMPPMPSPLGQVRAIRTLSGNQIVIEENGPAITLQTAPTPPKTLPTPASPAGPHQTVRLSSTDGIVATGTTVELTAGASTVKVGPTSISLSIGGSEIKLSGDGITIRTPRLSINSGGDVRVVGSSIRLN